MAKEDSKLTKDLERLNRRIQEMEVRLRESGAKAKNLEASLQAANQGKEDIKHKRKARKA